MTLLSSEFLQTYLPDLIVSRETILNFETYFELLTQWNKAIPLVQEKTLGEFIVRHIIDSLQIAPLLPGPNALTIDIGTGAGFPGLALAIYGFKNITLIESNRKKTLFLEEVTRKTKAAVTIRNERAESITEKFDFIVSRACSSLTNLLLLMQNVSRETSVGIFHKGASVQKEIEEAELKWTFDYELKNSITDDQAKIIIVRNVGKKYG